MFHKEVNKMVDKILKEVELEVKNAMRNYKKFNSSHEAYAVLLEEVDELWDAIRMNQKTDEPNRTERIREEAIQVAAMAIRLIFDCCYKK